MISHNLLTAFVIVILLVFGVLVSFEGGDFHAAWFSLGETTVTIVAVVLTLFNLWLWRVSFLQRWLVRRPHIWGKWSVSIKSNWQGEDEQRGGPIIIEFDIKQTFSKVYVKMSSERSNGELICSTIVSSEDGSFRLVGTYRNEPNIHERLKSPIHYGTFILDVMGNPNRPEQMRGHYWTDRDTKGEMLATRADT